MRKQSKPTLKEMARSNTQASWVLTTWTESIHLWPMTLWLTQCQSLGFGSMAFLITGALMSGLSAQDSFSAETLKTVEKRSLSVRQVKLFLLLSSTLNIKLSSYKWESLMTSCSVLANGWFSRRPRVSIENLIFFSSLLWFKISEISGPRLLKPT